MFGNHTPYDGVQRYRAGGSDVALLDKLCDTFLWCLCQHHGHLLRSRGQSATLMAKRLTIAAQQAHSWAVYHIKNTPAKLVGIIEAPDKETAIKRAIQGAAKRARQADGAAAGLSVADAGPNRLWTQTDIPVIRQGVAGRLTSATALRQ